MCTKKNQNSDGGKQDSFEFGGSSGSEPRYWLPGRYSMAKTKVVSSQIVQQTIVMSLLALSHSLSLSLSLRTDLKFLANKTTETSDSSMCINSMKQHTASIVYTV